MSAATDIGAFHEDSASELLRKIQTLVPLREREKLAEQCFHDLPQLEKELSDAGNTKSDIEALRSEVEARMDGKSGFVDDSVDWGPVVTFDKAEGRPFPVETLTAWVGDFVSQLAEATQTPVDMAAMFALGAIATAVGRRFEVQVQEGYHEPLNIFVTVAMPPGSRKSQVCAEIQRPILDFERAEGEAIASDRIEGLNHVQALKKRNEKVQSNAAKEADAEARGALLEESRALAIEIMETEMAVPVAPRLVTGDVTPEGLAALMHENGERMAIWSAEGGEVFEMMRGRYAGNGRANLELHLKAHAGDAVRVDRKGGQGPIAMDNPCLTMSLAVQPSVIQALSGASEFRDRGMLGRFLFSFPASTMGRRRAQSRPVERDTRKRFAENLRALLHCEGDRAAINLTPEAFKLWCEFYDRIEPQLTQDAALGSVTDWAGKLPGAVARIAGLLHCAECTGHIYPSTRAIDVETMRRAVTIGDYLIDHALVAFSIMSRNESDPAAQKVLRCIQRLGALEFRERGMFQKVKGGVMGNDMVMFSQALSNLEARGYVAKAVVPAPIRSGAGRPRSQKWAVNPDALDL